MKSGLKKLATAAAIGVIAAGTLLVRPSTTHAEGVPPGNAFTACQAPITGTWAVLDTVFYGPSAGLTYPFSIQLLRNGNHVVGVSDYFTLDGTLQNCTLTVTYGNNGNVSGQFNWEFAPNGSGFTGTFTAPNYGNGGSSLGLIGGAVSPNRN
jgi:hypothetical protein